MDVPAFSLIKELVSLIIFMAVIGVLVIAVEIEYRRAIKKNDNVATTHNLFEKIEEFRNDFDGDRQAG